MGGWGHGSKHLKPQCYVKISGQLLALGEVAQYPSGRRLVMPQSSYGHCTVEEIIILCLWWELYRDSFIIHYML